MRFLLVMLPLLVFPIVSADAEVHFGINIGINVPVYPDLVRVPGYPVYYNPYGNENYFFYDGQYWVYEQDNWYSSNWYNGPWDLVEPEYVPLYMLRVPVRYYRLPPVYFHGWLADAAPHWGDHWGNEWEARRHGWDHWDHQSTPHPAPLPVYQRQYSGNRYPQGTQQTSIRAENYHYNPREAVTQHAPQRNYSVKPTVELHQQVTSRQQSRPRTQTAEQLHQQPNRQRQPVQLPPAQPVRPAQQRQQTESHGNTAPQHNNHERDNKEHEEHGEEHR